MTDNGVSKVIDMDKTTVKRRERPAGPQSHTRPTKSLAGLFGYGEPGDQHHDNCVSYEAEMLNMNSRALTWAS